MLRFFLRAVPLIVLLLFLFSLTVPFLDARGASSLGVLSVTEAPLRALVGTWLLEAFGLIAIFLLVEGRSRLWWLDALLASWVAWIFRGPLLVVTLVLAAGLPQAPWFRLILAWLVLYSICGLVLGFLERYLVSSAARAEAAAEREAAEAEAIAAAEARVAQAARSETAETRSFQAATEEGPEPERPGHEPEKPGADTRKLEIPARARDPLEER